MTPDVSFAWWPLLLALAALALAVPVYVAQRARARRAVAAFASPALLPNLVVTSLGWRRHVPPLLLLLALAALVAGAARPQRTTTVAVKAATIVLAIDSSRSMAATDVRPSRLAAAQAAARTLVAGLPADARVGVVSFTRVATPLLAPTAERSAIEGALGALRIGGGTAIGDAIEASLTMLTTPLGLTATASSTPGAIVVLSDGASTEGKVAPLVAARHAREAGVAVYAVSLGTPAGTVVDPGTGKTISVAPDPASLDRLAREAGGRTFTAASAAQLRAVYGTIARDVGTKQVTEELAAWFLAAAAALVVVACAASLRWQGELV